MRLVAFLAQGLSVATCLRTLRLKGWERHPSQRTVYYHLKDGVIVPPSPPTTPPPFGALFI